MAKTNEAPVIVLPHTDVAPERELLARLFAIGDGHAVRVQDLRAMQSEYTDREVSAAAAMLLRAARYLEVIVTER